LNLRRPGFFWKLALSYAVVLLVAAASIGWLVQRRMALELHGELEQSLRRSCLLLEPLGRRDLPSGPSPELSSELREIGQACGQRFTLIRPDGVVLADSDSDPMQMDNHAERPEVLAALRDSFGSADRESATLGQKMRYVAYAVREDGEVVLILRASKPVAGIERQLSTMRRTVAAGAGLGAMIALAVGLLAARRFTQPIEEITETARSLSAGSYGARVRTLPNDETGVLGKALNELARQMTLRLTELTTERAHLRATLLGIVEGVIAVDAGDRVLFCNDAAKALLFDHREPVGERLWETVRLAGLDEVMREAAERNGLARKELVIRRGEKEIVVDVHASPLQSEAEGMVVVLYDRTDLRRLERVRRDFAANVSHELKTPLTSIHGYVETLLNGALNDENNNVRFLKKIDKNVLRLTHLVSDLLSLARIESQENKPLLVPLRLDFVLAEVVQSMEEEIRAKELRFTLTKPAQPVFVRGDHEALIQVVGNLLDNAVKYTPQGGRVELRVEFAGDSVTIAVADNGIGIPSTDLTRVFERFYRVDKARSRDVGGTGLGLSIVKHLVSALEGEIEVQSELGRGSTFRVRLARALAPDPEDQASGR
jgi:two-component system phosphate regulon sensor histidine kinase PhoR